MHGLHHVVLFMTAAALVLFVLFFIFNQKLSSSFPNHRVSPWTLLATTLHDPTCFTQGLQFINESLAIETCGLYGQSRVQLIDFSPFPLSPPLVIKSANLSPELFAEGITLANGEAYVSTWKEHLLLVLDPRSLELQRLLSYPLEGWGLVYRPSKKTFLSTNGSNNIFHLKIESDRVSIMKSVPVICNGLPISNLNELELVDGDDVLSNVWQTNKIYRINPDTGECLASYDLTGLKKGFNADVLNGIAAPLANSLLDTSRVIWVTGKQWHFYHKIKL